MDPFFLDDADFAIVLAGSFATKGKAAAMAMRKQGKRVGLLRLRMIRPLPREQLQNFLSGRRGVAVVDQNLAPGLGGILFQEIAASLYHRADRPGVLRSFVGGLGGKDISMEEFEYIIESLEQAEPNSVAADSELLYTSEDWQKTRSLVDLAQQTAPSATTAKSPALPQDAGKQGRE